MFRASCVLAVSGVSGTFLSRNAGPHPVADSGLEEYEPVPLHSDGMRDGSYNNDCSDSGPGPARHTAAWYQKRCDEINGHCKFLSDHRLNAAREDRQFLKDECEKQKRILADKKAAHADEKAHVSTEIEHVADAHMEVKEAEEVVKDYAHCPPELSAAQAELARLQAIANKVAADIDAECKAEQLVHEKQQCVDKLRVAEAFLLDAKGEHAEEKSDLSHEKTHVQPAASKIPPQEEEVIEACENWKELENRPLPPSIAGILNTCKAQKDDLLNGLEADLSALESECARQKRKLDRKEDAHQEEAAEHDDQKIDVAATKVQVDKAVRDVKEKAHCPPELEKAQADLARLEAIPNKSPADIDAECEAHQRILVAEKCVDEFRAAEAVLAHKDDIHDGEKAELHNEAAEAASAKAAVPPQEAVVAEVCGDWEAAKARWEAAHAACQA